jgi:CBS domain-containing protein
VGIFGFKDMMTRAIAKELPIDETEVAEVMTPNPESVSPDMTVVEALQVMHDNKFLTLPVCEEDGTVVGLVDVMDLIYSCGGADGWRSIFGSAMDCDDDMSADGSSSVRSGIVSLAKSAKTSLTNKTVDNKSRSAPTKKKADDRPVSKLRPSKPLIADQSETVLEVCQLLAKKRGRACLIAAKNGGLAGILTDHDVVRRVVAKHVNPATNKVTKVMTRDPMCVEMNDSAMEALTTMIENHYRYLPVIDDEQAIVGLLDIGKVLNDAITKLERSYEKSHSAAEDTMKQQLSIFQGVGAVHSEALKMLLKPMMAQAFGGMASPTLGSLLIGKRTSFVDPGTNVLDAAIQMADTHKAALVVEDGELLGIVSFKDVMSRALAKELSMEETPVSEIMTPESFFLSLSLSLSLALSLSLSLCLSLCLSV